MLNGDTQFPNTEKLWELFKNFIFVTIIMRVYNECYNGYLLFQSFQHHFLLLQMMKLLFPIGNQLNVDSFLSQAVGSVQWPRPIPSENDYIPYSLPLTPLHILVPNLSQDTQPALWLSAEANREDCLYLLELIVDTVLESGASDSRLSHFGTRTCM